MIKGKCNSMYVFLGMMMLRAVAVNAQGLDDAVVKYTVINPDEIQTGKPFRIDVWFTVKPGWYIYAPDGSNAAEGKIETKVIFISGQLIRAGRLKLPSPVIKDGHQVYKGDSIVMSQVFNAVSKSGRYEVKGKVMYQTCNSEICMQPVTQEIVAVIKVK